MSKLRLKPTTTTPSLHTLEVVTLYTDDGAGGFNVSLYNNEEELLADHHLAVDGKVTDEQRKNILDEEDPYANGYIEHDTIDIIVNENGTVRLAKPVSMHFGQ